MRIMDPDVASLTREREARLLAALVEFARAFPQIYFWFPDAEEKTRGVDAFTAAAAREARWPVPEVCSESRFARAFLDAMELKIRSVSS